MSDARKPVIIEIDGSGSLVSNVSTFAADPKNFVSFVDCITDVAGRIRKRPGKVALGASAGARITAIHEYVYTNVSTGAVTYFRLRTFGTSIQYNNAGTWTAMTLPYLPTAAAWVFTNYKNRVFGVNGSDAMIVFDGTGTTWRLAGQDGPPIAATYTLLGKYTTGTITGYTNGSPTITGTGTTWVTGGAWNGLYIDINGIRYQISTVASTTTLTLTENFKEASAGPALTYTIYSGVMGWDLAPRYAYAYYNPTTGHCSNIRAAALTTNNDLQLSETNQVGVTPQITIAGNAAHTSAYNNGYTQIKIFRTPKNGNILVAINTTVNNNNTGSAIVFTESSVTGVDTALTTFEAPLTINAAPPTGLTSVAAYQGRLFALSRTQVDYTAIDPEVSIGVAEECWAPKFYLNVSEPLGLSVVGGSGGSDNLIIQTNRGDFSVDGYDVRTYYAYILPTRRSGSAQYNSTVVDGSYVSFYGDKRVVVFPASRQMYAVPGTRDLAQAIQNKLNTISDTLIRTSRIHWFANQNFDYVFLSVPKTSGSTDNDYTYVLNRDLGGWYEWNAGFTAFGTCHNSTTGALELWAGDSTGAVYQLLSTNFQDGGSNFTPTFTTSLLRPFGSEYRGRLAYVKAYVSDGNNLPTGNFFLDEQATPAASDGSSPALALKVASYEFQSAVIQGNTGRELLMTPSISTRGLSDVFQFTLTMPTIAGDYYFDRFVAVFEAIQDVEARA